MIDAAQIFSVDDLIERCDANDRARNLSIYAGHVDDNTKASMVMMYIVREPGQSWPEKRLKQLQALRGNFTAVFRPGNEVMYCSADDAGKAYNFSYAMQGGLFGEEITPHHGKELKELLQMIVELEKRNAELEAKLKEASEELAYYSDGRNKFASALEDVFMRVVPRLLPETKAFFQTQNNSQTMQGTEQNWQNIDVNGNTEQHVENALAVMLTAFGEENILKFARMIQRDPGKVDMLIKFL